MTADVLLEDWKNDALRRPPFIKARSATIKEYQPNRVVVDVEPGEPGYLVLADIWYPGWQCTVDGEPAELYYANYLFRATRVGEGEQQVVFTFAPESYQRGRVVSLLALVVFSLIVSAGLVRRILPGHVCSTT